MTKSYYRIILGRGNAYAEDGFAGGFIGADYGIAQDLTPWLGDDPRAFRKHFSEAYLNERQDKTPIAAGLAAGALWTVAHDIKVDDVVLVPDGTGRYRVGVIVGGYEYVSEGPLPHRRKVAWSGGIIERSAMDDDLRRSCGSIGTVADVSEYAAKIDILVRGNNVAPEAAPTSEALVATSFRLESILEAFLQDNWEQTDFGRDFELFKVDGETDGRQVRVDTGKIDLLALSKDKRTFLVVELKRGRTSDDALGQVLRYMGCVKDQFCRNNEDVRGVIIGQRDDLGLRRALTMVQNVDFYRYEVSFQLLKTNVERDA